MRRGRQLIYKGFSKIKWYAVPRFLIFPPGLMGGIAYLA